MIVSSEPARLPTTRDVIEVRWHGRGGEGLVTAGELLAEAALLEGKYFQCFPEFGPERSGAPMRAFSRVSDIPISLHCPIEKPGAVVVLDATLLHSAGVFEGLTEEGYALVNASLDPKELRRRTSLTRQHLVTLDATAVALQTIGRNIPNVPMLGALVRVLGVVKAESCRQAIVSGLGSRLARSIVDSNIAAFDQGYTLAMEG